MITSPHTEQPVAGVRYYLSFNGRHLGVVSTAIEAMESADRNPGMIVEAEVWNLVNCEYGIEKTEPRRRVYPLAA